MSKFSKIIGISKDSIKKHKNFIEKQDLKIKLASDEEGNVIESFGVWVDIPSTVVNFIETNGCDFLGSIHGANHILLHCLPLFVRFIRHRKGKTT